MLNYDDGLGVREALRERFPVYSKTRDADLLRSGHIPFNMLASLSDRPDLMRIVLREAFGLAMMRRKDIARFVSATLYPAGNKHFTHALMKYQVHLKKN